MCRRCQICGPIDRVDEPDLFVELAAQRVDVALARLEPAARQRPSRRRRELEAHEQHTSVGVDDSKARTASRMRSGRGSRRSSWSLVGRVVEAVVEHPVHLVDALARLAQRQLLRVTRRDPHVPAQRFERCAVDPCLEHLRGGALARLGLDDVGRAGSSVSRSGSMVGDCLDRAASSAHSRHSQSLGADDAQRRQLRLDVGSRPVLERRRACTR